LIVTDGLNYKPDDDFGLDIFFQTLKTSTIHSMTPIVTRASRGSDPFADITLFKFNNPINGLSIKRYDVVFLLGINRENDNPIMKDEIYVIELFMQDGGGVFATGDHEDLGAAICKDIARVRYMRYWYASETPGTDTDRLSTISPGDDFDYDGSDQSDKYPQRLYPNYRTVAGGVGEIHPLLDGGPSLGPIEVFPDHFHEGECRIPNVLTTTFDIGGTTHEEWPVEIGGVNRVSPEMVALSMSHGNVSVGPALVPRSFMAIAAYDGHRAKVGRVSTDATWHHFTTVNLRGFQVPPGTDTIDLKRIKQYFVNLATWLMPKNVRRCLRIIIIFLELFKYPLYEELDIPPFERATGENFHNIGQQIVKSLARHLSAGEVEEIIFDSLALGVGDEYAYRLISFDRITLGKLSGRELGLAALGSILVGSLKAIEDAGGLEQVHHEKTFANLPEIAKMGVYRYSEKLRASLTEYGQLLGKLNQ
jgi:hypothetical protein